MPQERIFYKLFKDDAANVVAAALALTEMLRCFDGVKAKAANITTLEHEGDRITHEIFHRLNVTFVTPIEREDITALASMLDSVIDLIEEIAAMLVLYGVKVPSVYLLEASTLLVTATDQIALAIDGLEGLKGLKPYIIEVNRIENEGDGLYRNAISELFTPGAYEPLEVIKWNRLYDLMEKAFDKCEDVANVIDNLVIKNA
jgi:predicted phosphate transport protein (TIGR00153 family)